MREGEGIPRVTGNRNPRVTAIQREQGATSLNWRLSETLEEPSFGG